MDFKQKIKSQRGSAVLMAMMGLLMLGGLGATTVAVVSTTESSRTNAMASEQASALAQAGIEYAKNRIDRGLNPNIANHPLGTGTFSVVSSDAAGIIAIGQVGDVKKTYSMTTDFAAQCVDLDVSTAHTDGTNKMLEVKVVKSCMTSAIVTDWTISWEPNLQEKIVHMQANNGGLVLLDAPLGHSSGTKINTADLVMNANGVYPIDHMRFGGNIESGKSYTMTIHLADGSEVTKTFLDPTIMVDETPGYEVENNGNVVVEPSKTLTVKALCSEITYGANGPKIPVKMWLGTNGNYSTLFGGASINGGETYTTNSQSGKTYTIKAKGQYNSWSATYNSNQVIQVKTLINNEQAPPLAGFGGQKSVSQCLTPHINMQNGKVILNPNQIILLFELGVNMSQDPNSTAADFQDLVVLLTVQ